MEHVDVRGPWPIYVNGHRALKLEGEPRNITVEEARAKAEAIEAEQDRRRPNLVKGG